MANEPNGKSKLIYYLLALLQTIVLAWAWRMENTVSAASTRVAILDANYTNIMGELKDIKRDVRSILLRK